MDIELAGRQVVHLALWEVWSFPIIEVAVFAIAALVVRDAVRTDRSTLQRRAELRRAGAQAGWLRRPSPIAGSSDDSAGRWPRTSFLIRAVMFTLALEGALSHRISDIYIAHLVDDRTPYSYPDTFLISLFDVPLWIPVGWAVIFYLAMVTSDRLITVEGRPATKSWRIWRRAALARAYMDGVLALTIDFALDPIAQAAGWWTWTPREHATEFFAIPISNFVAWFAIIFFLSLFVRTARMFVGSGRPHWGVLRRGAYQLVFVLLPMGLAFGAVFVIVLGVYTLDSTEAGFNAAMLLGAVVLVGALLISSEALPLRRNSPYDPLLARSAIALHVVFVVVMLGILIERSDAETVHVEVMPPNVEVPEDQRKDDDGRRPGFEFRATSLELAAVLESTAVGGDRRVTLGRSDANMESGPLLDLVAVDVEPRIEPPFRPDLVLRSVDNNWNVIVRPESRGLLSRDPELSVWMPAIAGISLLLFTWPYWDDLSSRILSPERRRHWIFEF